MSEKRRHIYRHNGMRGSLVMAYASLNNIITSPSITPEASQFAVKIAEDIIKLHRMMETRVDPWKENQ